MVAASALTDVKAAISAIGLSVQYGNKPALIDVSLELPCRKVSALIGPSGCGKSTFLRSLNRLNDRIPGARTSGKVLVDGMDPYSKDADLMKLRRKVGMVFQKPNPFPMTIFENVALGPRTHYGMKGRDLEETVELALRDAALWGEVKDDLRRKMGGALSGGQQQRLCIARALAVQPDILLMDEPCSALDPLGSTKIEELIAQLAVERTVVVVTHNLPQAQRISDVTAFFMLGRLVEMRTTDELFRCPIQPETADYIGGRFG